ncbi:DUF600 family protein [Aliivibrio fischeri]|uniref:immunity protein YezG family protein n=1 Tax=Aliivibrio fischeri TaxID=668 RepID=UPI0012DA8799|nr:immunity protein YezG family protein [Aliivibrio fischeri]MUK94673.1 DUF600 family protein [Aliivibrio fischeri]
MFNCDIDIYQHIGQAMFNALPDKWDRAYFYFKCLHENGACEYQQMYSLNGDWFNFSVNKIDGEYEDAKCVEAFNALYQIMKKNDSDTPWNKARFELMPDGNFDIQFKYDEDFAWLVAVDHYSDAFERLSADDMNLIKSWDGVPDVYERYWLK